MKPSYHGQKVTVAMATFNGGKYLVEQVHSILAQTLPPTEIIICDDRSTDNTVQIIQDLQKQYPVIKYMVNEERLGVISNFKKAVSFAGDTDYIALSDQDDIWMPDKLQTLCSRLGDIDTAGKPALVYSDMIVVNSNRTLRNKSFWNELGQDGYRHCFETLLLGNFVTGCSIMINKEMRKYFAEMPSAIPMHDAWLSLIAFSFGVVDRETKPLVEYRSHATNALFSENGYRKKTKSKRLWEHVRKLFSRNDFLQKEIGIVELFAAQYQHLLSSKQASCINEFVRVKNSSYLQKILLFRRILNRFRLQNSTASKYH